MKKLLIMSIALVAIMATVFTVSAFAANTVTIAENGISITEYTDPTTNEVNDAYVNVNVTYTAVADPAADAMSRITFMLSATTVADELEGNEAKIVYIDEQVTPTVDAEGKTKYSFVAEKARIQTALGKATLAEIEGQTLYFKMGGVGVDEAEAVEVVYNSPKSNVVYGDINYDNQIDPEDSLLALKDFVGLIDLTTEQITIADVDGNNQIDPEDSLNILKHFVGLINVFPVEATK